MVLAGNALPDRTVEESGPDSARSPGTHPQLFSRSERVFQRRHRGPEQQSKSHYEKILRVPDLPSHRTGPISLTWQAARARTHPQIFLRNLFSKSFMVTP